MHSNKYNRIGKEGNYRRLFCLHITLSNIRASEVEFDNLLCFTDGQWNDLACGVKQAFVCKRPYDQTAPVTLPVTNKPEGGCPDDWYKLDSKCYSIQGIQGSGALNFDDARAACQAFPGGEFASIHHQGIQCKC